MHTQSPPAEALRERNLEDARQDAEQHEHAEPAGRRAPKERADRGREREREKEAPPRRAPEGARRAGDGREGRGRLRATVRARTLTSIRAAGAPAEPTR